MPSTGDQGHYLLARRPGRLHLSGPSSHVSLPLLFRGCKPGLTFFNPISQLLVPVWLHVERHVWRRLCLLVSSHLGPSLRSVRADVVPCDSVRPAARKRATTTLTLAESTPSHPACSRPTDVSPRLRRWERAQTRCDDETESQPVLVRPYCRGPLERAPWSFADRFLSLSSSPTAWLRSRQAVIKRGVTAREANRARVARSYKPKP